MKCKDCKYHNTSTTSIKNRPVTISCCDLTSHIVNSEAETACEFHNKDLSKSKICYNCKFYVGGHDWGLFCSHTTKYHHLGRFNDPACEYFLK